MNIVARPVDEDGFRLSSGSCLLSLVEVEGDFFTNYNRGSFGMTAHEAMIEVALRDPSDRWLIIPDFKMTGPMIHAGQLALSRQFLQFLHLLPYHDCAMATTGTFRALDVEL